MRRGFILLLAAALALAAAVPAQAAIVLGTGGSPAVALDPSGTAHIVFAVNGSQTYCRLPRNAKACDILTPLPLEFNNGPIKVVRRPSDGALLIFQGSTADLDDTVHGVTWMRYSTDGGATWQGPIAVGRGVTHIDGSALANDGGSLWTVTDDTGPIWFQQDPLSGPESRTVDLNAQPDGTDHGVTGGADIVQLASGKVLAVIDTDDDTRYRTFTPGADPFAQPSWTPFPAKRATGDTRPRLTTGKRGTFMVNQRAIPAQRNPAPPFTLRSYDEKRDKWRKGKAAGEDRLVTGDADLVQDAAGRLHMAWSTSYLNTSCIVYARTGTRSKSWFGPSTTLFKSTSSAHEVGDPAIAVGANGQGVAVWGDRDGMVYEAPLKQRKGRYRPKRDSYDRHYC